MRPRIPVRVWLGVFLAASAASSGCLRDDIFPEPQAWHRGTVLEGRGETARSILVPQDAERLRVTYEADLSSEAPGLLGQVAGTQLRLRDPVGRVHSYNMTRDGKTSDTFGGAVGGDWALTIGDPRGDSGYRVQVDWYAPKHEGWAWWKVWKR